MVKPSYAWLTIGMKLSRSTPGAGWLTRVEIHRFGVLRGPAAGYRLRGRPVSCADGITVCEKRRSGLTYGVGGHT